MGFWDLLLIFRTYQGNIGDFGTFNINIEQIVDIEKMTYCPPLTTATTAAARSDLE